MSHPLSHLTINSMDDQLYRYCEEHTSAPDEALNSIYRSIALHTANPNMASSPYQGQFLQLLAQITAPAIAVEVGSYAGYGAVCIARGLPPEGRLHIIEVEEEYEPLIRRHAEMASVSEKIAVHIGPATELIPSMPNGIGLAFVDADKLNYERYYDLLLPKMKHGGLLIFDNMLWYGRVLNESSSGLRCDRSTMVLQHLSKRITEDPKVDNILLPLRDGLMLCRVK